MRQLRAFLKQWMGEVLRRVKEGPSLSGESRLLEKFLREVMEYRGPLRLGLEKVLGKGAARGVFDHLLSLEEKGSYIDNPSFAQELGLYFVGVEEELGFYVECSYDEGINIRIDELGRIHPSGLKLRTRPFFLYWPKAIAFTASRVTQYGLPPFFTPWLHEFGHFLCYVLQERPLVAAMMILNTELAQRGIRLSSHRDFYRPAEEELDPVAREMVRTLLRWSALNEVMAIWWEDSLLRAMGFEADDYMSTKRKVVNPHLAQLESYGPKKTLDYICRWDQTLYSEQQFTRSLLGSFSEVRVEKEL